VQNFIKIGQTVSEQSRFFDFHDGHCPQSGILILKFLNFGFPSGGEVYKMHQHHRTKFHQNRSMAAEILRLA